MALGRWWAPELLTAAATKSLQSCPILRDPIDGSPPGSPVPGILQARPLEWVAISFSSAWKWKVKMKSLWLLVTPWTAAYQASPFTGFSRQEYWSGVPLPSPELLNNHPIFIRVTLSVPFDSAAAHLVTNHSYSCRYKIIHYSFHFMFKWLHTLETTEMRDRRGLLGSPVPQ